MKKAYLVGIKEIQSGINRGRVKVRLKPFEQSREIEGLVSSPFKIHGLMKKFPGRQKHSIVEYKESGKFFVINEVKK